MFTTLQGVLHALPPRRAFGFVKIAMGANFLFGGGVHQPRMLWELTSFLLANVATFPVDVSIHEYFRQQSSLGTEAAAHYALHHSVAWHRGVSSTFGGAAWKDEKPAEGMGALTQCSSHRLQLQQGGNFGRCNDDALSTIVWCDSDSDNRQQITAGTMSPLFQRAITKASATSLPSCMSANSAWAQHMHGYSPVRVGGLLVLLLGGAGVYTYRHVNVLPRRLHRRVAGRRRRILCSVLFFLGTFFFGTNLDVLSGDSASSPTPPTYMTNDVYGGWWACVSAETPLSRGVVATPSRPRRGQGMQNIRAHHATQRISEQRGSALPLVIPIGGAVDRSHGLGLSWLAEQRTAAPTSGDAAAVDTGVAVGSSSFAGISLVPSTGSAVRTGEQHNTSHILQLHGIGDLRLGSDQGYILRRQRDANLNSHAGNVQVRVSLEIHSPDVCGGRWNIGLVLRDVVAAAGGSGAISSSSASASASASNAMSPISSTNASLYAATAAAAMAAASSLHIRFHTNGNGLMSMAQTVESPLRHVQTYPLPRLRSKASSSNDKDGYLQVLLTLEADPGQHSVSVRALTGHAAASEIARGGNSGLRSDDVGDSSMASAADLRLCRQSFFSAQRIGAVSLRVEGDPECVAFDSLDDAAATRPTNSATLAAESGADRGGAGQQLVAIRLAEFSVTEL